MKSRSVLFAPGWYDYRLHRGIARFAREHNWHLIAETMRGSAIPMDFRGDGIISSFPAGRKEWKHFISQTKIPIVDLIMVEATQENIHQVALDNEAIGRKAAEYLLSLGFQNFQWISYSLGPQQKLRLKGFERIIKQSGFECQRMFWAVTNHQSWREQLEKGKEQLALTLKPLAVFVHNDYLAAHVIDTCLDLKLRVPEDIAVIGVENNELVVENLAVPLTSVDVNFDELGYQAAARLELAMNHVPGLDQPWLIPPGDIAVRKSTDVIAVSQEQVVKALQFIKNNFQSNIGVADVVRASGVSRRTLENLFKIHLRRSINGEIVECRLRKVKELLLDSDLKVKTIALQVGFTRTNYLHQLFKKRFNITPKQFRQQ